jgi:hypothetical protein
MARMSIDKTVEFRLFGLKIFSIQTSQFNMSCNADTFEDDFSTEIERRARREDE